VDVDLSIIRRRGDMLDPPRKTHVIETTGLKHRCMSDTIQLGIPKNEKYLPKRRDITAAAVTLRTGYMATNLENPSNTTNTATLPRRLRIIGPTMTI
jgi:hypothetical protein